MPIEIKVPSVGESINEVTLTKWIKNDGDWVDRDEVIAELESEKATFEINAEKAGILHTNAKENDTLHIGDVAGTIDDAAEKPASVKKDPVSAKSDSKKEEKKSASTESADKIKTDEKPSPVIKKDVKATPVAAAILADKKVDVKKVTATGSNGKITKHDVLDALTNPGRPLGKELFSREEKIERMSNLRRTISRRLVEAKNTTAMLTTFNEVDM
ncbi:MAG: biotin/lipoyl-containing protein, partial [Ginsengibacter sp.]